jgi:hypothetical protein
MARQAISCGVPGAALETAAQALRGVFVKGPSVIRPFVTDARLAQAN